MDATFVIPEKYQLGVQRSLAQFHIDQNRDYLAIETPLWLQIFVVWELIFQLPFFIYGAFDYLRNGRKGYSKHTWLMFLLYGFNAGFTSLICVIEVLVNGNQHGLDQSEVLHLAGLYFPTTILPFIMLIDFYKRINNRLLNIKSD